jgi:hypothetical protein
MPADGAAGMCTFEVDDQQNLYFQLQILHFIRRRSPAQL